MYSTYIYIIAATINYTALVEVSECLCMRVCVCQSLFRLVCAHVHVAHIIVMT